MHNTENSVFAAVKYDNNELLNSVKDSADKKFGNKTSYVKNLWVLKEYKKRGGKVKYTGKKPNNENIENSVASNGQGTIFVDLSDKYLQIILKPEYELVKASQDVEISSMVDDLETFEYCYKEDSFMADFIETNAEEKKKNVKLNKPFRTPSGPKKFSVYVKNDKGNIVKVNFGDPNMEIRRDDPERRKSFRARHNCDNPGPKYKAKFWSCKMWSSKKVSSIAERDAKDYEGAFDNYEEVTE